MGWKIYFWVLTGILILTYSDIFFNDPIVYDFIDLPITITAMVGLFGYAYKKCIAHAGLWRKWFFIIIVWDLLYNLYFRVDLLKEATVHEQPLPLAFWIILFLVASVIILPEYIALYLYGFRSKQLWDEKVGAGSRIE